MGLLERTRGSVPTLQTHSTFPIPWGSKGAVSSSFPGFCVPDVAMDSVSVSFTGFCLHHSLDSVRVIHKCSVSLPFPWILSPHSHGFPALIPVIPALIPGRGCSPAAVLGSLSRWKCCRAQRSLPGVPGAAHTKNHRGEEGTNVLPWAVGAGLSTPIPAAGSWDGAKE